MIVVIIMIVMIPLVTMMISLVFFTSMLRFLIFQVETLRHARDTRLVEDEEQVYPGDRLCR